MVAPFLSDTAGGPQHHKLGVSEADLEQNRSVESTVWEHVELASEAYLHSIMI